MRDLQLILRSLVHYRRTHLGVAAGAAAATAILVGALMVGDSVSRSLEQQALRRIGDVRAAMDTGDRHFTDKLAQHLSEQLSTNATPAATALRLDGVAIADAGRRRTPDVRVHGIDPSFWAVGGVEPQGPSEHGVVINRALARQLHVAVGEEILLRFAKPSALPRDIPLGGDLEETVTLRVQIEKVIGRDSFGNFELDINQLPPFNAFVDRRLLQRRAGIEARNNLFLSTAEHSAARAALDSGWRLEDAAARLRRVEPGGPWDLSSKRVFLDDALVQAAHAAAPSRVVSTYLVHAIESAGGKTTRYAMVAAFEAPGAPGAPSAPVPSTLQPDEIVVTDWLARELEVAVGDELTLRYRVFGLNRKLTEASARFTIAAQVPTEGPGGDHLLMPEFPGITDADSAFDWDAPPELQIQTERITRSERVYWEQHRGAPKAFVHLAWAERQGAWLTPYGSVTAVRLPGSETEASLRQAIRSQLGDATRLGLAFVPVRELALRASQEGVASYFGALFVSLGAFVIMAAITLVALLFAFNLQQRSAQIGVMLAMGFAPRRIRRLMLLEGLVVAATGALVGLPAGWAYAATVLEALSSNWAGAVADAAISFHVALSTPLIGFTTTVAIATASMWLVLRRELTFDAKQLMSARFGTPRPAGHSRRRAVTAAGLCFCAASLVAFAGVGAETPKAVGLFFGAGALMLAASLLAARAYLLPSGRSDCHGMTFTGLGLQNGRRHPARSLATVGMLASATFLIVSINAFRLGDASVTGTGGFALFARAAIGVAHDLDSALGAEHFGLEDLDRVRFLSMRARGGDEASCRNLNQPQEPPLLGVDASAIQARDPFRFAHSLADSSASWRLLQRPDEAHVVPGIVDDAVAQWVLKVGLGDTLEYVDDAGRPFEVRIVGTLRNSILQGYVVIDEQAFVSRFPSVAGNKVFLIDAPASDREAVARILEESTLQDYGLTIMATEQRLAAFNAVQNTYLSIFSALGGLGLVLGCVGLGLVVLRNILERRGELAMMRALGFSRARIRRLILIEHWALLVLGTGAGTIAAIVAIGPTIVESGRLPVAALAWTGVAVIASGLIWTTVATVIALRGDLLTALRSE